MPFLICVPGSETSAAGGPCDTLAAAVALRDALWSGSWGGQALLIVDAATRAVVRPCLGCRGQGSVVHPDDPALRIACHDCQGSGVAA